MTYIDPRLRNKTIEQYEKEARALQRRNYELAEELEKFEEQTNRVRNVLLLFLFVWLPIMLFQVATR